MRLIPEWRRAWRMLSVQIAALAVLWVALPADAQASILGAIGIDAADLPGVLGALMIVARLVAQPKVRE